MKKAISLLLALVMCLSLCACGGGNDTPKTTEAPTETTVPVETVMTKDELLASATNVYYYAFTQEIEETAKANFLKANLTYENSTVCIMGLRISEINSEYAVAANGFIEYHIYLPVEELMELVTFEYVRVVGTITGVSEGSMGCYVVDMKPAHVVDRSFEIHDGLVSFAKIDGSGKTYFCVYGLNLVPQYEKFIVYFSDEVTQEIKEAMETNSVRLSLKGEVYVPENANKVPESPLSHLYIDDAELIDIKLEDKP